MRFFDDFKIAMVSFFVFVAWLVSSDGLVRAVAVVWLIYPAVFVARYVRRAAAG